MRVLAFALALFAFAWAQDPEGQATRTTPAVASQVTPKTWASNASSKPPTIPSYSAPPVSYTTVTSSNVIYQVGVTPKTASTQAWTTITSGGGVWEVPVTLSSVPIATATPSESSQNTHKTRTIILSVIFSFIGAVILILGTMFAMRIRAQRRMRDQRSWAMRPGGWVHEAKDDYPFDPYAEFNATRASFPEPQVPAPAPSHTRQRSL